MEDKVRGSWLSAAQLLGFLRAAPADTLHPSSLAVPVCKHVWGERPQMPRMTEVLAQRLQLQHH